MKTLLLTERELNHIVALLIESKKEEFLKNKYNVDDLVIDVAKEIDPTPNNKYIEWLISRKYQEWMSNSYRVTEYLKLYAKDKIRKSLPKEYQDINGFSNIFDFVNIMFKINPANFVSKTEAYKQTYKGKAGKYKVYQPITYAQSCKLGSGTKWCTAADSGGGSSSFRTYTENDNILLIFIDGGDKYQYSTKGEFKDKENEDVTIPKDIVLWLVDNGYKELTINDKVDSLGMSLEEVLDGDLHVEGDLDLSHNKTLKQLPNALRVGGDLVLSFTKIEKLPDNLYAEGHLDLRANETIKELPNGLRVDGSLYLRYTNIQKLPNDLYVGGDLDLYDIITIKELPDGLRVGSLDLRHTNIEKLPNDLYVGGNLSIVDTPLIKYTDDEIHSMVKHIGGDIIR